MRYWIGFVLILALLGFMPRCGTPDYCRPAFEEADCDDANPCTNDVCVGGDPYGSGYDSDGSWLDCSPDRSPFYCVHREVDDGTSCEIDGQHGACESGDCELNGSGGVGGSVGAFEVQP